MNYHIKPDKDDTQWGRQNKKKKSTPVGRFLEWMYGDVSGSDFIIWCIVMEWYFVADAGYRAAQKHWVTMTFALLIAVLYAVLRVRKQRKVRRK